MATILLLGLREPVLSVISGLLEDLGHHVLCAQAPGVHAHFIKLALTIVEFCPQDTTLLDLINRLHLCAPSPTLVIGPELSAPALARVLAPKHIVHYLRVDAGTHIKRAALKAHVAHTEAVVLTMGILQLNVQTMTADHGGRPLILTRTEAKLLRLLMQNPGQWVDCATLGALVNCRNVQTHLSSMRRKLDACSAVPLLRGSPGQGYTMDARRHIRHRAKPSAALKIHLQAFM